MKSLKNLVTITIIWLLFTACQKQPKAFIQGEIKDCKECEGTEVNFMLFTMSNTYFQDIGKTTVKNGKFFFSQQIKQPGIYEVYYKDTQAKSFFHAKFYLPADTVQIVFDRNRKMPTFYDAPVAYSQLKWAEVKSTSPAQKELDRYHFLGDSMTFKFYQDKELLKAKFSQTFDSGDKALINQWGDSVNNIEKRFGNYLVKAGDLFVQENPDSEIALYSILDVIDNSIEAKEYFRPYIAALPQERRESFYGQVLDDWIKRDGKRKKNNQHLIGKEIRSLAGTTPNQQKLDAAAIFQQNKFTLVEFWASWCSPCRWEMPKYNELYQKYQGKGFDMIAVSIDKDYQKWTKAIKQDSIYVHHLSELKGSNGEDVQRFNVQLIPFNLLVDAKGKVVAADLNSEELKAILKKEM